MRALLVLLVAVTLGRSLRAQPTRPPITIDDLGRQVRILVVRVAPDGSHVAFLTVQGLPQTDLYEIALRLVATRPKATPVLLAQYRLAPENTFDANSGGIQPTAGQILWNPDSGGLLYTRHTKVGMEARLRQIHTGLDDPILAGAGQIEIITKDHLVNLRMVLPRKDDFEVDPRPVDYGLLVSDDNRFYGSLHNPKTRGRFIVQHWEYSWGDESAIKTQEEPPSFAGSPEERVAFNPAFGAESRRQCRSPDGTLIATVEDSTDHPEDPLLIHRTSQVVVRKLGKSVSPVKVLIPSQRPRVGYALLGWSPGGQILYYLTAEPRFSSLCAITLGGNIREIYKDKSGLSVLDSSSQISQDGHTIVVVRSTNVLPDELVKIDSETGAATTLFSPNETFAVKALPAVRFVPIQRFGGDFYGRLYLPADYKKGTKYPLVFTNYISTPGFYASVGDEVPILALVASGIAVFAMNSVEGNTMSSKGDVQFEIRRLQRPVAAMEWVYRKLTAEGIVEPNRCGLTGLSYGAEIAMYAYWNSNVFQALSVASAGWEPMNYLLAGIAYARDLDSRGFPIPGDGAYSDWKRLSAGLNARADLPPLLLQSSDGEEYFGNVEAWFRLRRAGAQVEWYDYPNEGHIKRSPANRWWLYRRNLDWFRFWLKDEEDLDPSKAEQYSRWRKMRREVRTQN
jgi:hypothetical protein